MGLYLVRNLELVLTVFRGTLAVAGVACLLLQEGYVGPFVGSKPE